LNELRPLRILAISRGSVNEAIRRFVMIEQLANKPLYNPGQPRSINRITPIPKRKPRVVAASTKPE
jgi:hypothetical protein